MVMDRGCVWIKHGTEFAMHSPTDINVFRIHKEPFIEKANPPQRVRTKQHEAPGKVRYIHEPVIAGEAEFELIVTAAYRIGENTGRKATKKKIGRRWQQLAQVLKLPIGIENLWHELTNIGILFHEADHGFEFRGAKIDVRVQDEVKI
ncbi:MAG: hypothetical protein WA399_15215 [Acidobacteriaceae bacterium]